MCTHQRYVERVLGGEFPTDPLVPLPEAFRNDVGVIQNLVEVMGVRNVAVISSKGKTIRSNHYHRTDWHFLYVVSGRVLYYARDVGAKTVPEPMQFAAGQMFFTPPLIEHVVCSVVPTVLVSLSRNPRDHESHEADVVRVPFIAPGDLGWESRLDRPAVGSRRRGL